MSWDERLDTAVGGLLLLALIYGDLKRFAEEISMKRKQRLERRR